VGTSLMKEKAGKENDGRGVPQRKGVDQSYSKCKQKGKQGDARWQTEHLTKKIKRQGGEGREPDGKVRELSINGGLHVEVKEDCLGGVKAFAGYS